MYRKVLIPLDGSKEAERVFSRIEPEVSPEAEIILCHVVRPSRMDSLSAARSGLQHAVDQRMGFNPDRHHQMPGESRSLSPPIDLSDSISFKASQLEEARQDQVITYLSQFARSQNGDALTWRFEAPVSESIAEAIERLAEREAVDLIAMYTRDRKGLAKWIQRSVSGDVKRKTQIEVKVFRPYELGDAPVTLMVERHAVPGSEEDLKTLLRELRAAATQRPGFLSGETKVDAYDPSLILTVTNWASQEAFGSWEDAPERMEIIKKINWTIDDIPTLRLWVGEQVTLKDAN